MIQNDYIYYHTNAHSSLAISLTIRRISALTRILPCGLLASIAAYISELDTHGWIQRI
jgi:hypothetical protein